MLGDNIRLLRSVRGISQVELGEKLNVSKQSISNWENGNIQPSIEMLMKIADFFSVSTDFLLGLDNRTAIIVDGLSTEELSHIRVIIDDLVAAKRRTGIEQNDDRSARMTLRGKSRNTTRCPAISGRMMFRLF